VFNLFEELETILNRLGSLPLRYQTKVDFDRDKQTIRLSSVVYQAFSNVPPHLASYVKARDGVHFRPYQTSYELKGPAIHLVQEFPCPRGNQRTMRKHVGEFRRLAKYCRDLFDDIAKDPLD